MCICQMGTLLANFSHKVPVLYDPLRVLQDKSVSIIAASSRENQPLAIDARVGFKNFRVEILDSVPCNELRKPILDF